MPDWYRKGKINQNTSRTDIKTSSFAISLEFEGTLNIVTMSPNAFWKSMEGF